MIDDLDKDGDDTDRMDEELQSIVGAEIEDAVTFADNEIGPQRAQATEYYRGDLFGDEEDGRSKVVSRDVADTVNQILPSLMRMFFGPEQIVEFVPQSEEDVESAEQATDYVNFVVTRDNPGFEVFYSTFKDALIRKCGVVKYWWDDSEETSTVSYTGLDAAGLAKLLEDLQSAQEAEIVDAEEGPDGQSVTIKLTRKCDRVRIEALPPEEFLIDRRARTIDDATFVAHRCMKTVSELVAMGYDKELVESQSQDGDELEFSQEVIARLNNSTSWGGVGNDPSTRLVLYVEGYLRTDRNGDGVAELVKVCTMGTGYRLVHSEEVETRNFAAFHVDPEPHTFYGQSVADKTMDIQRIKSALLRNALDALALSINPRMIVVTNDGQMQDAMNTEIGALLRAKTATGYVPIVTPDTSASAYNALTYMDQIKESRTGMNRVSQGLDPQALQNTTATAASAQFTQSQQHIELIARIFAETGMKRLFRGILKLIVENQRKERMINLRNKWVPIDPRGWRVDMDVMANVALGGGTQQEKAQVLGLVIDKQEKIMMQLGFDNPLVGLPEYHNAITQFVSLAGYKNPDAFFKDPADAQMQPQQPKPDPELEKVKAEIQLKQQEGQANLQIKAQEGQQKAQMDARKAEQDVELRRMEMEGNLALKREQIAAELQLKREQLAAELQLKRELGYLQAQVSHETGMAKVSASTSTVEPGGDPG